MFNHADYQKQIDYLAFKVLNSEHQVFAFSSIKANEGKTTTTLHTAHALKKLHRKVCVVHADMKESLEENNRESIVSYLEGKSELDKVIQKNEVFEVDELVSSPSNKSSVLISSKAFDSLLLSLKEKYDMVLIDCGSLTDSVDPMIIAKKADVLVLVVAEDVVSKEELEEDVQRLKRNEVNIFGAVLNKAKKRKKFFTSKEG